MESIGKGTYGQVVKAQHIKSKQNVAIKRIHFDPTNIVESE